MTAKECIMGRRSVRKFTEQPISHDVMADLIQTASYAPSWKNTQITRYFVVEGETKEKLAACTSAYAKNGDIMRNAAAVVAIAFKKGRCGFERDGSFSTNRGEGWQMFDAGIATQTFCLAAHEQGLGTVIQGIFDQEEASKLLEIPEDMDLMALISIGYPAETPNAPARKAVEELLTYK